VRALLVTDALAVNGAVRVTLQLARHWAPSGTRLAVVRRQGAVSVPAGVDVGYLTRGPVRMRYGAPAALARLTASARAAQVVVACSEIGVGLLLASAAARSAGRPLVIAVHADLDEALAEWMPRRSHPLFRRLHRRAAGAVCVAPALVEPLLRNGLPPARVRVVRNGIDAAAVEEAARRPAADPLCEHAALPPGTPGVPVVVATGRLSAQKGHDLLLRAHARVVGELPHRLLLLNDGPDRQALHALAAELGVRGSVHVAGAVPEPLPAVARADLFCLPSRHEGMPLALLEAVALGVPVVAADCSPGVRAALDGGRVGELVPAGDVGALAAALAAHLRDPSVLRARANGGPEHARGFDVASMADGWSTALAELAARPGQRP